MSNLYANDFEKSNKIYYDDLKDYKPLSKIEERRLCKRFKLNNDLNARDQLIKSNLKFVVDIAKKYKGYGLPFGDIVAEGNLGLIKALDKFDYEKNVKIISFGVWWIRQYIKDAINKKRMMASDELPNEINSSLNEDSFNDNSDIENDFQLDDAFLDKEKNYLENEKTKIIGNLLSKLNERECEIIKSYFGFNSEPLTLEEIGKKYSLTKERVRQIKSVAMKKLRSFALEENIYNEIYVK